MIIRKTIEEDKEDIICLIKEFYDEYLTEIGLEFDEEKIRRDFDLFLNNKIIICLSMLDEKKVYGFISAVICERPFFSGISGQELIWYVAKDKRKDGIKLLKEFERYCKDCCCNSIIMIGLDKTKAECFYEKFGYKKIETVFVKNIGD